MLRVYFLSLVIFNFHYTNAFLASVRNKQITRENFAVFSSQNQSEVDQEKELRSMVASKFKILACSSTSCAKKREALNMDEYSTFSAFYSRIDENNSEVQVEESPCLGSCKMAPCVGIEHEDYVGTVSLEGMNAAEFESRW